jgi:hypothetical protein
MTKKLLSVYLLSFIIATPIIANLSKEGKIEEENSLEEFYNTITKDTCFSDCDSAVLKIRDICAKNIGVQCLKSCKIDNVNNISTDSLCAKRNISAKSICTDSLTVNDDVVLDNLTVNGNLCINDTISVGEICQKYRATTTYAANTTYTLGTYLNYDTILDDPNNNISLNPMIYTVPVTGYYIVNIQVSQENLVTTFPILGTPIANIGLIVNGLRVRTSAFPYLSFTNDQAGLLTALILLNAGDMVQATYTITVLDQTVGIVEVNGTVTIEGGSLNSTFAIHYLSSACQNTICTPSTVDMPCNIVCNDSCSRGDTICQR